MDAEQGDAFLYMLLSSNGTSGETAGRLALLPEIGAGGVTAGGLDTARAALILAYTDTTANGTTDTCGSIALAMGFPGATALDAHQVKLGLSPCGAVGDTPTAGTEFAAKPKIFAPVAGDAGDTWANSVLRALAAGVGDHTTDTNTTYNQDCTATDPVKFVNKLAPGTPNNGVATCGTLDTQDIEFLNFTQGPHRAAGLGLEDNVSTPNDIDIELPYRLPQGCNDLDVAKVEIQGDADPTNDIWTCDGRLTALKTFTSFVVVPTILGGGTGHHGEDRHMGDGTKGTDHGGLDSDHTVYVAMFDGVGDVPETVEQVMAIGGLLTHFTVILDYDFLFGNGKKKPTGWDFYVLRRPGIGSFGIDGHALSDATTPHDGNVQHATPGFVYTGAGDTPTADDSHTVALDGHSGIRHANIHCGIYDAPQDGPKQITDVRCFDHRGGMIFNAGDTIVIEAVPTDPDTNPRKRRDMRWTGVLTCAPFNPSNTPEGQCPAPPPTVTSVNPTSGEWGRRSPTVKFGATAATAVTVDSSTQITATAPSGSGLVDVTVTNLVGPSGTKTNAYTLS